MKRRGRPSSSLPAVQHLPTPSTSSATDNTTATGIGYSISESFAKAGIARIIILQRRESVLAAAKASLEKAYPNTKVETYIASQSDFPRITEVLQSVGEIDVLIPCATSNIGYDGSKPAKDVVTESLAESYAVNVFGLFHIVREFMALPSTASGGRPKSVIHVSSAASQFVVQGASAYCSTKAAANQLITHFGYDDPESNVKFYSYHPGAIQTDLAKEHVPAEMGLTWEDGEMFSNCLRAAVKILLTMAILQRNCRGTLRCGLRVLRRSF